MQLTLDVPDELASFLPASEPELTAVLVAGLRRRQEARQGEVGELADVAEMLATLPAPEEVLALRPSRQLAERTEVLLEKNRTAGLDSAEQKEWEQIMRVEHLVRMAKSKAAAKLSH